MNQKLFIITWRKELEEKGIIFKDTDSALRENEDLFREYFASVPAADNKFAALNSGYGQVDHLSMYRKTLN